jgi:hypothetical protein
VLTGSWRGVTDHCERVGTLLGYGGKEEEGLCGR